MFCPWSCAMPVDAHWSNVTSNSNMCFLLTVSHRRWHWHLQRPLRTCRRTSKAFNSFCFRLHPPSSKCYPERARAWLRLLGVCGDCGILRFLNFKESSDCVSTSTQTISPRDFNGTRPLFSKVWYVECCDKLSKNLDYSYWTWTFHLLLAKLYFF